VHGAITLRRMRAGEVHERGDVRVRAIKRRRRKGHRLPCGLEAGRELPVAVERVR